MITGAANSSWWSPRRPPANPTTTPEARRVLEILLEELPVRQAAQLAARITGGRKNTLYDLALEMKRDAMTMDRLTLTRPDDWHLHLRDGDMLAAVLAGHGPPLRPGHRHAQPEAAGAHGGGGRRLPGTHPGRPAGRHGFDPLMTLYLTDNTDPGEIAKARASGFVQAVKYYPAGATTNSDSGVTDIRKVDAVLEAMQEAGLPLLLHGEVTDPEVDVFDREAVFIDRVLAPLLQRLPRLKVVLEHITTRQAADFVAAAPANVAATVTAHHLLYNRNAMFQGGMRPHYYCLPVLKREIHRRALVEVATGGNPKFFLGTDSAPHAKAAKESACGCAGIYTAHAALELYAEAFEAAGALDRLEAFASFHGPDFYGLPRNRESVSLVRETTPVAADHPRAWFP
jgi:dihydroorotase